MATGRLGSQAPAAPGWPAWRAQPLAPPFAPLAALLDDLPATHWPGPADWNALAQRRELRNARELPLRFVPPSPLKSSALAFEQRILQAGEVETRAENWHDALHACAWLLFPRAKARINALHVQAGTAAAANGRSPLRDLLTLFDESGIVIACAAPELAALLGRFQWHELFWTRRAQVREGLDFTVFGHALYEHCHALYDGVTGKGIIVPVEARYFTWPMHERLAHLDAALAQRFEDLAGLATPRDLQPLPVKGIPGWAAENEAAAYYLDERQFRPGRSRDRMR